jgi:putative alpha-1,2-mannosidase
MISALLCRKLFFYDNILDIILYYANIGASAGPTLVDLYGSKQELLAKLHQLLVIPSSFRVGSYNQEIHEMTEMRALAMGQYGHNNQPSHHILYLFALLGDAATTQSSVRQVMERAYGRDFYAGDEDNGEQVSVARVM